MSEMDLSLLRAVLVGCFHEDWPLEASSPADAVRHFAAREPSALVAGAQQQLDALLSSDATEDDLRRLVLSTWAVSYEPIRFGYSMRDWLLEISDALRK